MVERERPSGDETFEIVQTFEELLGGELSRAELMELVNAVDSPDVETRQQQQSGLGQAEVLLR